MLLKLDTNDADSFGSVQLLLDRYLSDEGSLSKEYQCRGELIGRELLPGVDPGCQQTGRCREYNRLTVKGDVLIIQLKMFDYDIISNQPRKRTPNIIIDEELRCFDTYELFGIVWHSGDSANSGHYVSNVKVNGVWYLTNDTLVTRELKRYIPSSKEVPYILFYKKRNNMLI